jgi:hypothetical protein
MSAVIALVVNVRPAPEVALCDARGATLRIIDDGVVEEICHGRQES